MQIAARKVLLHHVLIESCHYDGDEYSAEELFEEVLFALPIIKNEYAAMLAIAYRIYCLRKVQVEYIHHIIYNKCQGSQ